LPPTGPLDERNVHLSFVQGALPAGALAIQARTGAQPGALATAASAPVGKPAAASSQSAWLQVQTRRLIELISDPNVPPHILVFALLASMLLGALHAFAPGHGKTIVGAYLVGSRGTPRHALFLGVTVTITHTLIVFVLGLATFFASRFFLPERVFPILSLISGLLVFGMGVVLLVQRWHSAREALAGAGGHAQVHDHGDGHDHGHAHVQAHAPARDHADDHAHEHPQGSDHDHGLVHATAQAHDHGVLHTHGGGTPHSHLPPAGVSWRSLLALGVSGGLLPCPSAMVLLLGAVALHKTFYGLLLVVTFSVGLAVTLTAVGMAFLYARNRFARPLGQSRWVRVLPVLSAALITGVGAVLCYGALATGPV
jgi:nickel/cobalt exporter